MSESCATTGLQPTTNMPVEVSPASAYSQADQTEATNDAPPKSRRPSRPSSRPRIQQHTTPGGTQETAPIPPAASSAAYHTSTTPENEDAVNITAPSLSSAPNDAVNGFSEPCYHLQHLVYAESFLPHLCPLCKMEECINDVRKEESIIKKHDSGKEWPDNIHNNLTGEEMSKADRENRSWTKLSKNKTLKRRGRQRQVNHTFLSHRKARTNLQNMVENLEAQRDRERMWDRSLQTRPSALRSPKEGEEDMMPHFPDNHTLLLDPNMGSATNALKRLQACIDDGTIGGVETLSANHSRKRAREMHMADNPDFPGRQDYHSNRKAFHLTQEQHDFVATAGNDHPGYDLDQAPDKRKRRHTEKTDFHSYVYTRSETDVDLLFSRTIDRSEEASGSILCTEPRPASASPVPAFFPQIITMYMNPPPKISCSFSKLNIRENGNRRWKTRSAQARPGYEIIDTSGHKMTFEEWDAYVDAISLPDTYDRSAEGTFLDDLQDQKRRELQAAAPSAKIPSHGVVASARALGGSVSRRALELVRRFGWL